MEPLNLMISKDHKALIERWIAEGKWDTADNIVMTALDEMQNICERDPEISRIANAMEKDRRFKELKAALEHAAAQADRGEVFTEEEVFAELLGEENDEEMETVPPMRAAS